MSYSLDSHIQEDRRTFPMYQRLRKINPYAYYSLNTQKQMQLDLRTSGSPNFFMVDPEMTAASKAWCPIRQIGVKRLKELQLHLGSKLRASIFHLPLLKPS